MLQNEVHENGGHGGRGTARARGASRQRELATGAFLKPIIAEGPGNVNSRGGTGVGTTVFERRGGELRAAADMEPSEPEPAGVRCSGCLAELLKGELYGVRDGRALCAECADEEWSGLTAAEKLEILGYEVEG